MVNQSEQYLEIHSLKKRLLLIRELIEKLN